MRKAILAVIGATALAGASGANAALYVGSTLGCFGVACAPVPTQTYGGLTFTTGSFNQADSNGFLAIGSGSPPTDTLGLFTLTGAPFNYTAPSTLFTLLVTFVSPGSTSGSYSAAITGSVSGDNTGGVFIDFPEAAQLFTYTGGAFTLKVNDLGVSATSVATPITGVLNAVPEPGTWALMLLGFGGIGLAMRRRRSPALAQLA